MGVIPVLSEWHRAVCWEAATEKQDRLNCQSNHTGLCKVVTELKDAAERSLGLQTAHTGRCEYVLRACSCSHYGR